MTAIRQEEDALFEGTLRVLRQAFELRNPDAFDRALAHRNRHSNQGQTLLRTAGIKRRSTEKRDDETGLLVLSEDERETWLYEAARLESLAAGHFHKAAAVNELMEEFRNANLLAPRGRQGPTPEAGLRPGRDNALLALVEAGHLDRAHEGAAHQISHILEALTGAMHARAQDLGRGRGGGGKVSDFMPAFLAEWHHARYLPWVGMMLANVPPDLKLADAKDGVEYQNLELVLTVVRDGISLYPAARQFRMGWKRGLRLLRNGLELYILVRDTHENYGLVFHGYRRRLGDRSP